jgi:hypothetical protein
MRRSRAGIAVRALSCVAALALSACGSDADDAPAQSATATEGPVEPSFYSGDVRFRIAETLEVGGREVPLTLFLGLSSQSDTRLGVEAFIDLRRLQTALPAIVLGTVEASCGLGLDVELDHAEADGQNVRAWGTVHAHLYRCPGRGTEQERRGMRLLTQSIDVVAVATAGIERDCVAFRLVDLNLSPKGLIGRVANLFGVTERARATILERATAALASNPICPELPEGFARLDPRYTEGGPREIGEGGMGAALKGSVDTSAGTLISLLELVKARGIVGAVR